MSKTWLLRKLDNYRGVSAADVAARDQIRNFVLSTDECFARFHLEGHVTGSAWLIDPRGEQVLLTHHRKLGRWLQLGGHSDGDPFTLGVALREAQEESGIIDITVVSDEIFDLDVHEIPGNAREPKHVHYDVRFILRAERTDFVVSEESSELAWVPRAALPSYTNEPTMLRMWKKWNQFLAAGKLS